MSIDFQFIDFLLLFLLTYHLKGLESFQFLYPLFNRYFSTNPKIYKIKLRNSLKNINV